MLVSGANARLFLLVFLSIRPVLRLSYLSKGELCVSVNLSQDSAGFFSGSSQEKEWGSRPFTSVASTHWDLANKSSRIP